MSTPMVSMKLIFTDGTNVVVAAPTRELWAGADGVAYAVKPGANWKPVAVNRASGILIL